MFKIFQSRAEQNRILIIDVMKVIGIYLVIFAHYLVLAFPTGINFQCSLYDFIYMFHMPLFFILSGFLYKQKSRKENLTKILYCLLIPYLIYQFSYLPLVIGNRMLLHDWTLWASLKTFLPSLISPETYPHHFIQPICDPCWFIMVLIHLRLLFCYFNINLRNLIGLSLFCIVILKLLAIFNIDLYLVLDNTLYATVYFVFGVILKQYINKTHINLPYLAKIILILLSAIGVWEIYSINGLIKITRVLDDGLTANNSILLAYIAGILGSLMICFISSFFKNINKFFDTISKNTLFIIFFHWFILFLLKWANIKNFICIFNSILLRYFIIGILSFVVLFISYYIILFLQKRAPIVLGKY